MIRGRLGTWSKSCLPIFRGEKGIRDTRTCVKLEINSLIHRNTEKQRSDCSWHSSFNGYKYWNNLTRKSVTIADRIWFLPLRGHFKFLPADCICFYQWVVSPSLFFATRGTFIGIQNTEHWIGKPMLPLFRWNTNKATCT